MTQTSQDTAYQIDIPDAAIEDLHRRLDATRGPDAIGVEGWSRGVPPAYLKALTDYWRHGYDWRTAEAELNELPNRMTTIDGQQIHFLHVRSTRSDATPLLLLHGWPGSFVEFLDVLGPLSEPESTDDPAFHLVVPSHPGFGLSGPSPEPGWGSRGIAQAYAKLMADLGYDRYLVQGGDFGAFIAPDVGRVAPDNVIGLHVNAATMGFMPFHTPGDDERAGLSELEQDRLQRIGAWMQGGNGYAVIQMTRPQTIGYALHDSPVGQLAWIVEKFQEWTGGDGLPEASIDRDRMLTNVMLYWLTGTATSAANNCYAEGVAAMGDPAATANSGVPTAVLCSAEDISIRAYSEEANTIVRWTDLDVGGHFAALEIPAEFVADVRAFAASLT